MLVTNKKANLYLKSILNALKQFENEIESIILFGSQARNEASSVSDVDLLIILKNNNRQVKNKITGILRFIELEFSYANDPTNLLELLLTYINIATGMFKSWFICSKSDFREKKFFKITETNRILGRIFAPSALIMENILRDGKVIYGRQSILDFREGNRSLNIQPFRSLILNEFLALGALIISPFSKLSSFYSLESIKWSLFMADELKIKKSNFLKVNRSFFTWYYTMRKGGLQTPYFSIYTPLMILKIHFLVFHSLKKIKTIK